MRPHLSAIALFMLLTAGAAPLAAQAVPIPPILVLPRSNSFQCEAREARMGRDSLRAVGDTSVGTMALVNWMPTGPAGTVSTTKLSVSSIREKMLANDLRLPPMTEAEKQAAVGPSRPLSLEELAAASRLMDWLLERRCAVGSARR